MLKISANPTWEWPSRKPRVTIPRASTEHRATPFSIRQTILPRSLDIAFSLKYRR